MSKIRVTIDITPQLNERLEVLTKLVEAGSKVEVIRRAIQLYGYLAARASEGDTFCVISPDGRKETIVLLELPKQ